MEQASLWNQQKIHAKNGDYPHSKPRYVSCRNKLNGG